MSIVVLAVYSVFERSRYPVREVDALDEEE
jgi:hypothetical protein